MHYFSQSSIFCVHPSAAAGLRQDFVNDKNGEILLCVTLPVRSFAERPRGWVLYSRSASWLRGYVAGLLGIRLEVGRPHALELHELDVDAKFLRRHLSLAQLLRNSLLHRRTCFAAEIALSLGQHNFLI